MPANAAAEEAVKGLTDWTAIAKLVEAFGGGWEAVATILGLAVCVTFAVCWVSLVAYWIYDSKNRGWVEIEKFKHDARRGGP